MKWNLYAKFILAYFVFGILTFLYIHYIAAPLTDHRMEKNHAANLYEEAVAIADAYGKAFYTNQISSQELHTNLGVLDDFLSASIWIMNPNGKVLLSTGEESSHIPEIQLEDFDPTDSGSSNYMVGTFYDYFTEKVLSVTAPITSNFETKGYVVIHTPYSQLTKLHTSTRNTYYVNFAVTLLLSLIIMVVFGEMVYKPLKKIKKATQEFAKGNMEYRVSIKKNDEIGQLADSLNYMSHEISRGEDFQKKFIANVSHDFRSPLTSIKGYAQAMMDGTIQQEQYDKYLNIIVSETERLQNLTESILTLNRYDSNSLVIETIPFDINQVIKDTAALFEGKCKAKKITIQLILSGSELMTQADKGKIQQVIYNLVDNAIKFSHNSNRILVETTERNEKIFVSVKDFGIGIPKESLSDIWNRFYKTDLSRGKDKKGSGLGLSITREIIYAHGEAIDVISTEGVGSEFIFSLEKARNTDLGLL